MNNIDFLKYKNTLREVLSRNGIDSNFNLINCFNPSHPDKNPSMIIRDDYYKCNSCGIHGDVYDAMEILRGITDKKDQFAEVSKLLGDNYIPNNNTYQKKDNKFRPNLQAVDELEKHLENNAYSNWEKIDEYLKQRSLPEEIIKELNKRFIYWLGKENEEKEFDPDIMKKAGIPGKNPKTNICSWGSPGVVLKIGVGFKLFFYNEQGKSQKIGSKGCKTFPFPSLPDSSKIMLVEGELSALSMYWLGHKNTVAIGGVNSLIDEDLKKLLQYDEIYILFDSDRAGRTSREKLKTRLMDNGYTGEVFIVRLPEKKDPDDLIKEGNVEILQNAIEKSKHKTVNKLSITQAIKTPFVFLGYDYSNNYYVLPKNKSIPIRIGANDNQIKSMLYDIAPKFFWENNFNSHESRIEWFRSKQTKRGLYDQENILGVGAHLDENKNIIVNLGDGLYIPGLNKKIEYEEYEGECIFRRANIRFKISGNKWTLKETHELFNEISNYGFSKPLDLMALTGFITLAPFASLLHRRPHLAIIGAKGCGKTSILENIISPAIGDLGIYVEAGTSEAGIRQKIGKDCRPAVIDEFEAHNAEEEKRNKNVLSLARSAYGGEGEIIKGTTGGSPITFKTKMMFCFMAINIALDNDADRTRIAVLKMKKSNSKLGHISNFEGLRKRTFENWDLVTKNIEDAKKYLLSIDGIDNRMSDTYGTLIGGFWSTVSEHAFLKGDKKLNQLVLESILELSNSIHDSTSDELSLLDMILSHKIKTGVTDEETVAEALEKKNNHLLNEKKPYHDTVLRQLGIRKDEELKIEGKIYNALAVSINSNYIKDMLKNSPHREYKNILIRHPSVIFENTVSVRMAGGKKHRCIIFCWEKVKKMHFMSDEEDINPF